MSERPDVAWFTLANRDSEVAVGERCSTREEAIAQGRRYFYGGSFVVAEGQLVTENKVAEWCCDQFWTNLDSGNLEVDLEVGSEDPIFVEPANTAVRDEFVSDIVAVISKHQSLILGICGPATKKLEGLTMAELEMSITNHQCWRNMAYLDKRCKSLGRWAHPQYMQSAGSILNAAIWCDKHRTVNSASPDILVPHERGWLRRLTYPLRNWASSCWLWRGGVTCD